VGALSGVRTRSVDEVVLALLYDPVVCRRSDQLQSFTSNPSRGKTSEKEKKKSLFSVSISYRDKVATATNKQTNSVAFSPQANYTD
jgi:hypothetical protein